MSIRNRTWTSPAGETKSAWEVSYRAADGKRVRKLFDRKKDADVFHATARVAVQNGTHTPDGQSITVAAAAQQWLAECDSAGLERVTSVLYAQQVRSHIDPHLGGVKLSQLTAPAVSAWENALRAKGCSPKLIRRVRINLGQIVGEAQRRGQVAQNVVRSTGKAKVSRRQEAQRQLVVGVDIPSPAEIRQLLPQLQGRIRPLILTAAFAGLRWSELRGLTWANVDLGGATLKVTQRMDRYGDLGQTKSAAGNRSIPLLGLVVTALKELRLASAPGQELVFVNSRGNARHRITVCAEFTAAQVAAGIVDADGNAKYSGLHALRHFFASWCINRKVDGGRELPLKVVQGLMGHSTISVTADVYGHLFPRGNDQAELVAAETAFLAG